MSAISVRCPKCAKRLSPRVRICPACGAEQPLHILRIRCSYCGRRIPANALTCPHCDHDPRRFYWRPVLLVYGLGLALLALVIYVGVNRPVWVQSLALSTAPKPTATVTHTPIVVIITATPTETIPAPATETDTPRPSPTDTRAPTLAPTPTATATLGPSPVVPPLFPTLAAPSLPAPVLESPADGQPVYGPHKRIALSFHGMAPLREHDWFRIQVDFKDRNNQFASWCGWGQSNSILLPSSYYDDSWQLDRTFHWHVNIAETNVALPSTCSAPTLHLGAPSPEWTFYWY
ncbi:MAG: zinc ribbon domain-containing protein [Anaerolineae bacterium]